MLGICPEHFSAKASVMSAAVTNRMNVIDPLENDMDVYANTAMHDSVIMRLEAQEGFQIDSLATVFAAMRKVCFLAPGEAGANLSQTSEPTHAFA